MIITIDGPSVSGKSTLACMLAQKLHFFYLNTGMLYRAFAYAVLHEHIDPQLLTDGQIAELVGQLVYTWRDRATMQYKNINITDKLYQPAIDVASSRISALPNVRTYIDAWQHALADGHDSVIDGRDSGSVVFAQADHKFYVTASDDIRAQRWVEKQRAQGNETSLEYAHKLLESRDQRDMHRSIAPLVVPQGARVIVNDGDDPAEAVQQIMLFF